MFRYLVVEYLAPCSLKAPWWNGRHAWLRTMCFGVKVQILSGPPILAQVMKLANMRLSESRFCGFNSRPGHQFRPRGGTAYTSVSKADDLTGHESSNLSEATNFRPIHLSVGCCIDIADGKVRFLDWAPFAYNKLYCSIQLTELK